MKLGPAPRRENSERRTRGSFTDLKVPFEACVTGSKERSESIVSPKNSSRTGSEACGQTSTMPPRTLNSPGVSTSGTRSYSRSRKRPTTSDIARSSPTANSTVEARTASG